MTSISYISKYNPCVPDIAVLHILSIAYIIESNVKTWINYDSIRANSKVYN